MIYNVTRERKAKENKLLKMKYNEKNEIKYHLVL